MSTPEERLQLAQAVWAAAEFNPFVFIELVCASIHQSGAVARGEGMYAHHFYDTPRCDEPRGGKSGVQVESTEVVLDLVICSLPLRVPDPI